MADETEAERTRIIREKAKEHLRQYLESDGEEGYTVRGVPTLILTTTGRRTRETRKTPLMFGRDGENFVLVASLGGAPTNPNWYLNLCDDPEVELQLKAEHIRATAHVATGEERARLWRHMTSVYPTYVGYQAATEREIPVVVVEPRR